VEYLKSGAVAVVIVVIVVGVANAGIVGIAVGLRVASKPLGRRPWKSQEKLMKEMRIQDLEFAAPAVVADAAEE